MVELATLGLTGFQCVIVILLVAGCFHYIWLAWDPSSNAIKSSLKEGFQSGAVSESEKSRTIWFENDELFDSFYASV